MQNANMNGKRILAIGAHPDDIEFGCGAFLLAAKAEGAQLELVVLSRGEAGSFGNGAIREKEARDAADLLDANLRFLETDGDTRIRAQLETTLQVAKRIRRVKPDILLAPSGHIHQHPDHRETSLLVRDAHRLARYGNTPGLEEFDPHATHLLLFYDISSPASDTGTNHSILMDVSNQVSAWKKLMECHSSQIKNLDYMDLQLSRARVWGIQMGVHSAIRLYSEGPLLVSSVLHLGEMKSQRF